MLPMNLPASSTTIDPSSAAQTLDWAREGAAENTSADASAACTALCNTLIPLPDDVVSFFYTAVFRMSKYNDEGEALI